MLRRQIRIAATFLIALIPVAAFAQSDLRAGDADPLMAADSVFSGDFLIVGGGAVLVPSYEGSDDMAVIPAAAIAGRLGGIGISARAAGLALDFIPQRKGERLGFTLGPVVRYRSNRAGRIADPVVARLGKLSGVIEGGLVAGIDIKHVLNPYDSLSFSVDFRWDISGKGGGRIVSPGFSYLSPLSKGVAMGAAVMSNFVDTRYAQYNFGISAAGSTASGLPAYTARGGLKDVGVGAFTAFDFNGNFLDGGPALGVGALYSRLYGSAAESPITAQRGKRGQVIVGSGLSYTF